MSSLATVTDPGQPSAAGPALGSSQRRVLVTRARGQSHALMEALRAVALEPVLVPAIEIAAADDQAALRRAAGRLPKYRWVVATSTNGVEALLGAVGRSGGDPEAVAWAVIGTATQEVLARSGREAAFLPSQATAATLAAELPLEPGDRVLVVRGELAGDALARELVARGATVDDVVAYRTIEAPASSREALRSALVPGSFAVIIFTSGSTVRGLHTLAAAVGLDLSGIPAICIGEPSAKVARSAGHDVIAIAPAADAEALATCARAVLAEAGGSRT